MNKRLLRDISNLIEDYQEISILKKDKNICIIIGNLKFHVCQLSYPFAPPKLMYKNLDYMDLLSIQYPRLVNEMRRQNIQCFCCNSLLYSWLPTITLDKIVREYINHKKTIKKLIINSYIRIVCYKNNLFEEELILTIFSYIV